MSARSRFAGVLLRSVRWGIGTVWRFGILWAAGTLMLGLVIALLPGVHADGTHDVPVAVVLVAATTAVLRPLLAALAVLLSWPGVIILGLLSQAIVVDVGFTLAPGIHSDGFGDALAAAWLYALLGSVMSWLLLTDDEAAFLAHVMRSATRGGARATQDKDDDCAGVVIVQFDGLSWPLLHLMVNSGDLPTISRWVRSGSHAMVPWQVRVPCTTPVSQAGILHGSTEDMPGFRWYEKESGRLLVANRPADAALIEQRLSNGRGLLADDGASISNLFSGDAATSMLTMSGVSQGVRGLGPSRNYASFFIHPYGFARALLLSLGEIVIELYQGRRQRVRRIEPRISRRWSYVILRAVTNVLLRDLNTALVAEQMMRGRKTIYVDYVDYDEIAHHAGPLRPESLRSLTGLDQVLNSLERVAEHAPRRYEFVLLSDHGQAQGATFLQRFGHALEDVVREGAGGSDVAAATSPVEEWGPVNTFLSDLGRQSSMSAGVARRSLRRRTDDGDVSLGAGRHAADRASARAPDADIVVAGSGNLGMIWFTAIRGRASLESIERAHPGLVQRLTQHPGVGWLLACTDEGEPVVLGARGVHRLGSGEVTGEDPLQPFRPGAAADLKRIAGFGNAADLFVGSLLDPATEEVAAFEELVGSHGGLGGWQQEAVLVHPAGWSPVEGPVVGAEEIHQLLVRRLEELGHRTNLDRELAPASAPPQPAPVAGGGSPGSPPD